MMIDKLWLRIKGELLTLKDDVSEGENLRARAERLLQKLDEHLGGTSAPERAAEGDEESDIKRSVAESSPIQERPTARSIQEIEEEWRKLVRLHNETKGTSSSADPPPPNPRKLG